MVSGGYFLNIKQKAYIPKFLWKIVNKKMKKINNSEQKNRNGSNLWNKWDKLKQYKTQQIWRSHLKQNVTWVIKGQRRKKTLFLVGFSMISMCVSVCLFFLYCHVEPLMATGSIIYRFIKQVNEFTRKKQNRKRKMKTIKKRNRNQTNFISFLSGNEQYF